MLNYNHLYYFHVAASEGSVAAAAERLRVTQPTVSEQVRALERALDVILFERLPTGLKLTEAGRLTYEHTSVMFRAGERIIEALGQNERDLPRILRIGISNGVARATTLDFLMPLLALEQCMPTIKAGDGAELVRELRASEIDLAICENEPPEATRQGIEFAIIDRIRLVAVAPPSVVPEPDWQNVGFVHYPVTSSFRWEVESFLEAKQLRPRVVAEADDALFLLESAARGGYVSFVPRSVARDAIASGRVRILDEIESSNSGVVALYQESSSAELARRAVEVLIEHVQAMHGDQP
jgi:LysR family transcriptional activator of nhaA